MLREDLIFVGTCDIAGHVRGKGFPAKDGAGDLLVTLEIVLPADAGDELRQLMEAWRERGVENPRKDL